MVYEKFVKTGFDESGVLNKIEFTPGEHFNFGFDVVDALGSDPATASHDAMLWVSGKGEERRFTFADMARYSSKTANYLESVGVRKGDRVLLVLKRHYQFWFVMVALHKIGAIVIPATNQLMKKDFVYRFNAAGVKAVIATSDGDVWDHIEQAVPECPELELKIMANGAREGWLDLDNGVEAASDVYVRKEPYNASEDIMLMLFTSGTTGYPRIAAHTYTYPLGHFITAKYWHNVKEGGLHFTISDTGWGKALWGKLYGQWLCGATVFTYDFDRFHADEILSYIDKYKVTTFCAPPTMYRFFIKEDLSKYSLKSLEYACTAGEALNPEVYNKFLEYTGLEIHEGFGQTETTLTVGNLVGAPMKIGSMGKPSPGYKINLLNSDGSLTKTGDVGEIVLDTSEGRPIGMYREYYRDPEKTASAWHDGYYHTGDMAWRDEDGYFWYVGRDDDLIKSSGYRIGPFEIESVLMEHPSVLECAVTGVPDELRGKAVKATIVLAKGYAPSEELKKELQDFVKKLTAPYKYPRVVEFVDELPKTISGKIRRVEIRKRDGAE